MLRHLDFSPEDDAGRLYNDSGSACGSIPVIGIKKVVAAFVLCHAANSQNPTTPQRHFWDSKRSPAAPSNLCLHPQPWTLNIFPHRITGTSLRRNAVRSLLFVHCDSTDSITGVLGATGSVGQRFILLLALHPHFVLHAVGASERSAGKKYKDAVKWKQSIPFSERIGNLVVKKCTAEEFSDCDLVFSGLDSDVAGDVGMSHLQPKEALR
jgi:hypothetical protein